MDSWLIKTNEEIIKDVGNFIRKKRLEAGITQRQLAQKTGMGMNTIHSAENGANVGFEAILRIGRVLGFLENIHQVFAEGEQDDVTGKRARPKNED